MSEALTYCWKEWRAQRGLLVAYSLLVFFCLCLGLYLAPRHYWFDDGFGVHALSWFVAAGVIGVVAFVVPNLVRAEFTTKGDQFLRRLPGALWPAFWGKLIFLVLACVTMPLLGLAAGELFVTALGHSWEGLYKWNWDGSVALNPPMVTVACGLGLLWLPWVWATGAWTPGGRLALLASILLLLLLGVGVFAVERQSPNIIRLQDVTWLWWLVPLVGFVVAALSSAVGRRGGGPLRSARVGLLATGIAIAPVGGWLGVLACSYHWPDANELAQIAVTGSTADDRFVLAHVTENEDWCSVSVRVDLHTGEMKKLGGIHRYWWPGVLRPEMASMLGRGRYWRDWDEGGQLRVLDLEAAETRAVSFDKDELRVLLPENLRGDVERDRNTNTRLVDGNGHRIWLDRDAVCYEAADGFVERVAWDIQSQRVMRSAGLGVKFFGGDKLFDFVRREMVDAKNTQSEYVLRHCMVYSSRSGRSGWFVRDGEGKEAACEQLKGMTILGLWDPDRVLAYRAGHRNGRAGRLVVISPHDGRFVELAMPSGLRLAHLRLATPMGQDSSLLQRDPDGGVWLQWRSNGHESYVRINESLDVSVVMPSRLQEGRSESLLMSWQDLPEVLVCDNREIIRINIDTGEREVLFPRR